MGTPVGTPVGTLWAHMGTLGWAHYGHTIGFVGTPMGTPMGTLVGDVVVPCCASLLVRG